MVIIPTVDAEGVHGRDPFKSMMLGVVDSGEVLGVERLAQVFSSLGIAATFFVDVYEHSLYGVNALRGVCESLRGLNQDIQLHTHPAWRDDVRDFPEVRSLKRERGYFPQTKDFMYKCTLDEQVSILRHGVACLTEWCGVAPVAHRAGGYGVNENTIRALREVGIPVDSSMLYGHPNCKVAWSRNRVVEQDGIVELPVTGFWREDVWTVGPLRWRRRPVFQKTDLDACSLDQLLWFVKEGQEAGLGVMNLFMHSYSLLKFDHSFSWFQPDLGDQRKLEQFVEIACGQMGVEFASVGTFWRKYRSSKERFEGTDVVPLRQRKRSAASWLLDRVGHSLVPKLTPTSGGA